MVIGRKGCNNLRLDDRASWGVTKPQGHRVKSIRCAVIISKVKCKSKCEIAEWMPGAWVCCVEEPSSFSAAPWNDRRAILGFWASLRADMPRLLARCRWQKTECLRRAANTQGEWWPVPVIAVPDVESESWIDIPVHTCKKAMWIKQRRRHVGLTKIQMEAKRLVPAPFPVWPAGVRLRRLIRVEIEAQLGQPRLGYSKNFRTRSNSIFENHLSTQHTIVLMNALFESSNCCASISI